MAPFKKSSTLEKPKPGPSSSLATATAAPAVDDFSARRSSRVAAGRYTADNDTWVEALAVCEVPVKPGYGDDKTAAASKKNGGGGGLFRKFKSSKNNTNHNKLDNDAAADNVKSPSSTSSLSPGEADVAAASQRLTLRPYFQSQNTGQRVWDEPPSGASEILYATPDARKMAQAQLEEMKSTYAHAAVKRRQEREEKKAMEAASGVTKHSGNGGSSLGGNKLFNKAFKRASSASAAVDASQSSSLLGNNHKQKSSKGGGRARGTLVLSDEGGRRGVPKSIIAESRELAGVTDEHNSYERDLQKAMMMSMGVGGGSVMGVGENKPRSRSSSKSYRNNPPASSSGLTREEEEQLDLAKALSMSEQEGRQSQSTRRSKSSSNRSRNQRGKSDSVSSKDSDGEREQRRSRSQSGHQPSPHANYTDMKPPPILTGEFNQNFDGGGKKPAAPTRPKHKTDENNHDLNNGDFGDRGPSWELSWSHSASPTTKDWALS